MHHMLDALFFLPGTVVLRKSVPFQKRIFFVVIETFFDQRLYDVQPIGGSYM